MFCFVLFSTLYSFEVCPSTIKQLTLSVDDIDINTDWTYFYSQHLIPQDTLTVRIYSKDNDVSFNSGKGLLCSNVTDLVVPKNILFKKDFPIDSNLGVGIFGIKSNTNTNVVISIEGLNPNNHDSSTWALLTGIFLVLCLILLILLFVHAIMAREKVHYQVEVDE